MWWGWPALLERGCYAEDFCSWDSGQVRSFYGLSFLIPAVKWGLDNPTD